MRHADYVAIDAENWSSLRNMVTGSPLHYRHARETADVDTVGRGLGRAMHALALEPETFEQEYPVFTGKKRQGKAWDAFQAANAGRTIVKASELIPVRAQVAAMQAHPEASLLLQGTHREELVLWTDAETGIRCKCRVDVAFEDWSSVTDLKGCRSIGVEGRDFEREAIRMLYPHQLAFYRRGIKAAHGEDATCQIVAVEIPAPHDVCVWRLSPDLLDFADREISAALRMLARCRESSVWPGRFQGMYNLRLPSWLVDDIVVPGGDIEEVDYGL